MQAIMPAEVISVPRGANPIDLKIYRAEVRRRKKELQRQDLLAAVDFLKANPWLQVFSGLVIVDFLRYAGIISASKSSDIGLIIAGLGVGMNGGGAYATTIAALVGGAATFFPYNPKFNLKPPASGPGVTPVMPGNRGVFNTDPGTIMA